jgi:hypothetical protein
MRWIPCAVIEDLGVWLAFLGQTHRRISPHILTTREPATLYRADVCKHESGGFNVFHGRAWRFEIPRLQSRPPTLDVLAFLASIFGPRIDFLGRASPRVILHLVENRQHNSRWLDGQDQPPRRVLGPLQRIQKTGKYTDPRLIRAKSRLDSEWFPGDTSKI